jgi:hypothetical protein
LGFGFDRSFDRNFKDFAIGAKIADSNHGVEPPGSLKSKKNSIGLLQFPNGFADGQVMRSGVDDRTNVETSILANPKKRFLVC